MDLVLSSFCFWESEHPESNDYTCFPPISFSPFSGHGFEPDYAAFLLAEKVYVDARSLERIRAIPLFAMHVDLLDALQAAGRLHAVDFNQIVSQSWNMLNKSVLNDLASIQPWITPFRKLSARWLRLERMAERLRQMRFYRHSSAEFQHASADFVVKYMMHRGLYSLIRKLKLLRQASHSPNKSTFHDERLWIAESLAWDSCVRDYLLHVAAHMYISETLGAAIHEWNDVEPIYLTKAELSLRPAEIQEASAIIQTRKLLDLMFPQFTPRNIRQLVAALTDERVLQLRRLVDDAVDGDVTFDAAFARRVLSEVVSAYSAMNSRKERRFIGWARTAAEYIPVAGPLIENAVDTLATRDIEAKRSGRHGWYLLLSEIAW